MGGGSPEFAQKQGKFTAEAEIALCILSCATVLYQLCEEACFISKSELPAYCGIAVTLHPFGG